MRSLKLLAAATVLGLAASPAWATDTLSRSVEVKGSPAAVWARIGPFCAIQDWHPAIGACALNGQTPPTRTLKTKDGATFVELRTAASGRSYAYSFVSSPIPVTGYVSTLKVTPKGKDRSVVTWSGTYSPNPGQAKAANDALAGIYESGLAAIKAQFGA